PAESSLLAFVFMSLRLALCGMQHAERAGAVGPDEDQCILSGRNRTKFLRHVSSRLHRFAIDANNDVTALDTGIVRRASGLNVRHDCAGDIGGCLQFLASRRCEVLESETPARFAALCAGRLSLSVTATHRFQCNRNGHALSVTHDAELDGAAGLFLSDLHLK